MHSSIFICLCLSLHISVRALENHSSVGHVHHDIINFNSHEKKGSQYQVISSPNFEHNFNYSPPFTSNKSIYSNDDPNKSPDNPNRNFSLVTTFCAIALLIVLINLRVFRIVTTETQQRNKSINFFVAHLSFLAIGFTCVVFIYVMEKSNIFSLTAPGLCEILSLLRNTILSLFPLNSVAITYVRTRCSTSNLSNTLLFLAIFLIWTAATVGSLPSIFMVKYTKDSHTNLEKCKQIPLFGTFEATFVYELFRFFAYHFFVCFYMAYAMVKIRYRIRYLYILKPIPNKMKRRVQRVRFVYLHSIIFILIWLPTGFGLFLYKLRTRIEWMADYINIYIIATVVLCSSLFFLSPLVYVFLHEETSTVVCKCFGISGGNCAKNEMQSNMDTDVQVEISDKTKFQIQTKSESIKDKKFKKRGKRNTLIEFTNEMSRISTMAMTEASTRSTFSYKNVNFTRNSCLNDFCSPKESKTTVVETYVHVREQNIDCYDQKHKYIVKETLV